MNLNTMTPEELHKFHEQVKAHPIRFAKKSLGGKYRAVAAARDLANYALNRARLLESEQVNNTIAADNYAKICENIRVKFLPDYALQFLGD